MVVNIDKVVIKDRIRKDFGDIKELADDIKQNGLINPPVVNKDYELLAGERRLRACKSLGWKQIEVRMMDTRDEEHELEVEISENEVRKEFSRAERIDYARRLERIEAAKARGRIEAGVKDPKENFPEGSKGQTRDIVADKLGIGSGKQYEKEKAIVDNKELLEPEDFADWDEGRLSTNKAFQMIKARQQELEEENNRLRKAKSEREMELISEKRVLEKQLEEEKNKKVEKVEVPPEDYRELKEKTESQELRLMQLERIKTQDEDEIRKTKERLEKEKRKSCKLSSEVDRLKTELNTPNNDETPMFTLIGLVGKEKTDELIQASVSGMPIVIKGPSINKVSELITMMGVKTYREDEVFVFEV